MICIDRYAEHAVFIRLDCIVLESCKRELNIFKSISSIAAVDGSAQLHFRQFLKEYIVICERCRQDNHFFFGAVMIVDHACRKLMRSG